MNLALLAKLAWKIIEKLEELWAQVLWHKYGSHFLKNWNNTTSHVWRGITQGAQHSLQVLEGADHAWDAPQDKRWPKNIYDRLHGQTEDELEKRNWKRMWKLKGSTHLILTLWLARHDKLLTAALLFARHGTDNPICGICIGAPKTTLHALRDCGWCDDIWRWLVN